MEFRINPSVLATATSGERSADVISDSGAIGQEPVLALDPVTRPEPIAGPPTGEVPAGEVPTGEVPVVGSVPTPGSEHETRPLATPGPAGRSFTPEILDQYTPAAGTVAGAPATGTTAPVSSAALESDGTTVGPVEATSGSSWRVEERDTVRLSVQDHGIGIPARDLDRIFERFYRVDHGRSRDTGGTGLGLSIVRHVANNHQGWVDVESREGEGSTFTLVLPIQAERGA